MHSVYSPATTFQSIPRQWGTMSWSAVIHLGVIAAVVLIAGAAAGIVAPRVESDLIYVQVAPTPPLELPEWPKGELPPVPIQRLPP